DGKTVTTAITNLDIHDLARCACTYGLFGYFVVTPIAAQRDLVERILEHWRDGAGQRRMPERSIALALCRPVVSVSEAIEMIVTKHGATPEVVATAARHFPGKAVASYADHARRLREISAPTLLLFGTGHGLADEIIRHADHLLEPIR